MQEKKYGLYFEKNIESVKQIIKYADLNPNKIFDLKNNSKNALEKKYDWDYIVDQYIDVFEKLNS